MMPWNHRWRGHSHKNQGGQSTEQQGQCNRRCRHIRERNFSRRACIPEEHNRDSPKKNLENHMRIGQIKLAGIPENTQHMDHSMLVGYLRKWEFDLVTAQEIEPGVNSLRTQDYGNDSEAPSRPFISPRHDIKTMHSLEAQNCMEYICL